MTPRPDDQARTELRDLVAQASHHRDQEHERIETEFWQEIDRLQKRYHGAQQDVADALDVKRNQVLRQTKRYRSADEETAADNG
jgi:DNA-binding NtrC family response regulator